MSIEPVRVNEEVEALLTNAELPVSDLHEGPGLQLFGMRADGHLVAVVGVEVYGEVALLRSLVVAEAHRKGGRGQALVAHAESWAWEQGIKALYLLTTTAAGLFAHLGYKTVPRSEAPSAIAATEQFTNLCPSSATFMRKASPRVEDSGTEWKRQGRKE